MFTGIIKEIGRIESLEKVKGGQSMTIGCEMAHRVKVDQSININGVCHTVTGVNGRTFAVQTVEETLRKTNIGDLEKSYSVNLEPSLYPKQLLGGHLVQGHIDGTGTIEAIEREGSDHLITISFPEVFNDLAVARGSITIDGISLTIADLQQAEFTVAIIPYTFENTNMQFHKVGNSLNLEFDILGKYVKRYLENRQ